MARLSPADEPTPRQQQFVMRAAERVVGIAGERDEFAAFGVVDRLRSLYVPRMALQRAIYDVGMRDNLELQTYRPYRYDADSGSPYGALVVRVLARQGETVLPALRENELLQNQPGEAIEVYPPVD